MTEMRALATTTSDLPAVMQLAEKLAGCEEMIPKHFRNAPGKILAAVLTGRELGVEPMAALRAFHIVEGKPCADYSFWCARLKQSGYVVEWPHTDTKSATVKLTDSRTGASMQLTYSFEMAQRAGLTGKNNWKGYPEAMLRARALTAAGRAFAGEVMFGCYEMDEADELRAGFDPAVAAPTATAKGVAGLSQRLGVTVTEAEPTPEPAGPEPFGLVEEAIAACESCGDMDTLRTVKARILASRFAKTDGAMAKGALLAAQARIDEASKTTEEAAEDAARKA